MPDVENNENPIGTLRFTYVNMSRQQLVPTPKKDVIKMSKLIPISLSDLSVGIMLQTFGIFVGINIPKEDAAKFNLHPASFWAASGGMNEAGQAIQPDIKVLTPDINVSEALQLIRTQLVLLLETNNLSSTAIGNVEGQDIASGIALII
ncbi:MAG: hypothetical protein JRE23_17375, partial [Deltaproteobacteria bacterium]|nr:hypothetical protein [Deltaproteobacteria bacterium]